MKQSNRSIIKKLFKKILVFTENRYRKITDSYSKTEIYQLLNEKSDTNHAHDTTYVKKTGDTMNGALHIHSTTETSTLQVKYGGQTGKTNHDISMIATSTNYTGLYSQSRSKWYLQITPDGNASFNGFAGRAGYVVPVKLAIPKTDLNTIYEVGDYYCEADSTAKTFLNCPVTRAFALRVYRWSSIANSVIQEVTQYSQGIHNKYVRSHCSGSWGVWVQQVMAPNFQSFFLNFIMIRSVSFTIPNNTAINQFGYNKSLSTTSVTNNKSCYIIPYYYSAGSILNVFSFLLYGGTNTVVVKIINASPSTYTTLVPTNTTGTTTVTVRFLAIPV